MSTIELSLKGAASAFDDQGVKPSTRGLAIDDNLDFDAWAAIGERLGHLLAASAWWIGDWVNYGFYEYGKKYEAGLDVTGLAYGTLRNYASVCETFDVSRRRDTLSFMHHATVAGFDAVEQDEWLDRAEREGLSMHALRAAIDATRQLPSIDPVVLEPVRIRVEHDRAERWRAAAAAQELDLDVWAANVLDAAAA